MIPTNSNFAPIAQEFYKGKRIQTQGSHGVSGGLYKAWVDGVEVVPGCPYQQMAIGFAKQHIDKKGGA